MHLPSLMAFMSLFGSGRCRFLKLTKETRSFGVTYGFVGAIGTYGMAIGNGSAPNCSSPLYWGMRSAAWSRKWVRR
jgi:hypothetical protein